MFSTLEERVPRTHPLRKLHARLLKKSPGDKSFDWINVVAAWPRRDSSVRPSLRGRRCCALPTTAWCAWAAPAAGGMRIMREHWLWCARKG